MLENYITGNNTEFSFGHSNSISSPFIPIFLECLLHHADFT